MKYLHIFFLVMLLIGQCSCEKDKNLTNDEFPEWLQTKISELVPDQNLCKITDVTVIEYNGHTYFHIYCGIWSCMYCQLFDEQGNRPNWETSDWNDFFANKKEIKIVPACK